ncbi:hypothetical protein CONLIGDRAFT_692513 [Coniochaeta ligniaria NRRL 30616]|uniref:Uncharacterized protein n=1 Tax=Coniochaeta ligniaria NRRL 30616 TaxID=1408157 RepID=A0A1J7IA70_9PEZI|nr:hypothetical protein CONLIGDRAFT_692513 [Coniochaeta ligniaria NRRL 30616]
MTSPSFHKFPLLPTEIQQHIWWLASQRTQPSHFFTYFDDGDSEQIQLVRADRVIRDTDGCAWNLAVPESDPSSTAGLSRTMTTTRPATTDPHDDDGDGLLLGKYRAGGATTYVTIRPESDLVCVQPLNFDSLDWGVVVMNFGSKLRNLAIEYDESWHGLFHSQVPYSEQERAVSKLLAQIVSDELHSVLHFWFIDYRLKRRPGRPEPTHCGREEFWCSKGRFVQVLWGEPGWDWEFPSNGAHGLVRTLEDREMLIQDLNELDIDAGVDPEADPDDDDYYWVPGLRLDYHVPILGVLAFEPWC